ncbi:MAG: hypothetical protein K8S97_04895 [Anaerolineae bacterium]|nr:hypothetical protein [Anaerolineae bacterium]
MDQQLQELLLWHATLRWKSEGEKTVLVASRASRLVRLVGRGLQALGRRLQQTGQRLAEDETPAQMGVPNPPSVKV